MPVGTRAAVAVLAVAGVLVTVEPSAASVPPYKGCNVPPHSGYRGAPPAFEVPPGGSATVEPGPHGFRNGSRCVLRRRDGTLFAVAVADSAGRIHEQHYFDARERMAIRVSMSRAQPHGVKAAARSSRLSASCGGSDADWSLLYPPTKWQSSVLWWVNSGSIPAYLNVTAVIERLRDAAREWVFNQNHCGFSDDSAFVTSYQGSTSRTYGDDDYSNVDFGATEPLGGDADTVGIAISWYTYCGPDGLDACAVEGDFRLDTDNHYWFTDAVVANRLDVQSVAAHEWGHVAQFGHADTDYNIMYPYISHEDTSWRLLGRGDARGNNYWY